MHIFFRRIHLYLGLAAGLVIAVACGTGAILVFEKELMMVFHHDRYFVEKTGERLPIENISDAVKTAYPKSKILSVKLFSDRTRSVEVSASTTAVAMPAPGGRAPSFTFFVDPYSGKVLEKYSYRESNFYKVFALHRWLLGSDGSVGKYIVGWATFTFLFILITGIILWWPKTRNILRQRLRLKSNAGWKRINHDLHIVLGFYSSILLFIIAFTGLAWSFQWFNNGIYKVTNSPMKNPAPPASVYAAGASRVSLDSVFVWGQRDGVVWQQVSLPKDSVDVFTVASLAEDAVHESATDAVYLDQYTGKVLASLRYEERSLGARVRSTFKPVHTGSIGGWPTKVIALIVCLLGASFPITGTIMWLNRTRRKV